MKEMKFSSKLYIALIVQAYLYISYKAYIHPYGLYNGQFLDNPDGGMAAFWLTVIHLCGLVILGFFLLFKFINFIFDHIPKWAKGVTNGIDNFYDKLD